jgi:hypothetical protein
LIQTRPILAAIAVFAAATASCAGFSALIPAMVRLRVLDADALSILSSAFAFLFTFSPILSGVVTALFAHVPRTATLGLSSLAVALLYPGTCALLLGDTYFLQNPPVFAFFFLALLQSLFAGVATIGIVGLGRRAAA